MSLERLSSDDAHILRLESVCVCGHTCKVAVVEPSEDGAAPDIDAIRAHVDLRLPRVPRFRQKVEFTPLDLAGPVWVDDPEFDVREHVQVAAQDIPAADFPALVGRLMAERLDHRRPLWAIDVAWFDDGRMGIVWRIHHCMADGMTAIAWGDRLLWDSEPHPPDDEPQRWSPDSQPGSAKLLAHAARDQARRQSGATRPRRSSGCPARCGASCFPAAGGRRHRSTSTSAADARWPSRAGRSRS
jgi:diacylglycerol O-acyltransferase